MYLRGSPITSTIRLVSIGSTTPTEHQLLKCKNRIGSAADNDLIIAGATISRHHAVVKRRFRHYRIVDLESTNGTFINGRRVRGFAPITKGDELRFGRARFVFLVPSHRKARRTSWTVAISFLVALFATGYAVTQYFIDQAMRQELDAIHFERSTALLSSAPEPEKSRKASIPVPESSVKPASPSASHNTHPGPTTLPNWLQDLNHWRALAGVAPIAEDFKTSTGATAHARYIVKNYIAHKPETPHHEEPSNPWYTSEGAKAAPIGDEYIGSSVSAVSAIDGWVHAPFHRLNMLERSVKAASYGHYCESGVCGAVLVLLQASQSDGDHNSLGELPQPVMFPSNGMALPASLSTLIDGEWPDPLSCPSYARPAGYPITLQFDQRFVPRLLSFKLNRNGTPIEICGYDSNSYRNSDLATQSWGRDGLKGDGAIILIPKEPLEPGAKYTVSVAVEVEGDPWDLGLRSAFSGQRVQYVWSFSLPI